MKYREAGVFEVVADERGARWSGWSEGSKDVLEFAPGEELVLFPGIDCWPIGSRIVGTIPENNKTRAWRNAAGPNDDLRSEIANLRERVIGLESDRDAAIARAERAEAALKDCFDCLCNATYDSDDTPWTKGVKDAARAALAAAERK